MPIIKIAHRVYLGDINRNSIFIKNSIMQLNILNLISDEKCYDYLREFRWKDGLICPHCSCKTVIKNGTSSSNPNIHRYKCSDCCKGFNDLTNIIFANSNKSLKVWVMVLYFMGLNLSNRQIAEELTWIRKLLKI